MLALITEWGLGLGALGCFAVAGAAFIYIPLVGRYAAAALVTIGAGLGAYDFGFHAGASDGDARVAALAAQYNAESGKAVLAQAEKDRADAAANAKAAKDAVDRMASETDAAKAALAAAQAQIDAAPAATNCGDADAPAPAVILETVRGK